MDREILFRGFHKEPNGKNIVTINGTPECGTWLYGNLLRTDDGWYIIQNYVPLHMLSKYEVVPSTVGQYTGPSDKNGKKIFEGDILERRLLPAKRICTRSVVKFAPAHAAFAINDIGGGSIIEDYLDSITRMNYEIEVISSVHDNPELIGGEDDG